MSSGCFLIFNGFQCGVSVSVVGSVPLSTWIQITYFLLHVIFPLRWNVPSLTGLTVIAEIKAAFMKKLRQEHWSI